MLFLDVIECILNTRFKNCSKSETAEFGYCSSLQAFEWIFHLN